MADQKLTDLTADTSPTGDDLILTVNSPGGTPANRKVTLANAITKAHGLADGFMKIVSGVITAVSLTKSDVGLGNVDNTSDTNKPVSTAQQSALDLKEDLANKGIANGYAELDSGGLVPSAQLPSYVDDVLEYADFASLPGTGVTGKIYVTLDTNITYRWSGSAYVEISASLALGTTSSTAHRGDHGNTAYTHSQLTSGNPHNVTKSDVGLSNVDNTSDATKNAATATLTNKTLTSPVINSPTGIVKADVGLGNVTNDAQLKIASNLSDVASAATAFGNIKQDATTSATGVAELATTAETDTGTDATRVVTPDGLSGSYAGTKPVSVYVIEALTPLTTGDGKAYFRIPPSLNGMDLISVGACVVAKSTSGTPTIQIARGRQASAGAAHTFADMLSTKITIDANEFDSKDATTPPVVDTANDDVLTGDLIRIDVDVAGTAATGLIVTAQFRLP